MKLDFALTYEFEAQPPVTERGVFDGETEEQCLAAAAERLRMASQGPKEWQSLVLLLMQPVR